MHRQLWLVLCLASQACAASALAANAPRSVIDDPVYTHAQRLVEVGGRRMNLYCTGSGAPTIVLDSGLSDPDIVWGFVQPVLARRARVCSYDRAGIGYSDPATRASTTGNIVDDLHGLLHRAGISPPYLLVGHSLGGLNVQQYAYRYPREVAGMVLVDPAASAELEDSSGSRCGSVKIAKLLDQFRLCAAAASNGFVAGTELYGKCIDAPDSEPNAHFGPAINRVLAAIQMRPAFQRAQLSELESLCAASTEEVRAVPRRPYGDMPLEVLTSGESQTDQSSANSREKWAAHETVAQLSLRGVHRTITDSAHYIELDRPEAVVTAVEEIIGEVGERR